MNRRTLLRNGFVLAGAASFSAACTPSPDVTANLTDPDSSTGPTLPTITSRSVPSSTPSGAGRVLLAYFSRAGENYHYGDRIDLEVGNTQVVAEMIAAAIQVDRFRIRAAEPYPDDYEQTVARNAREQQDDARPVIADPLPDVTSYDTILLGSPVWNVQAPMILRTFLDGVELTDTVVHPFVTYAVSGMGRVRTDYVALLPGVSVTEGLAVQGEEVAQAQPQVEAWLRGFDLLSG